MCSPPRPWSILLTIGGIMEIHLRANLADGNFTKVSVIMDGFDCGQLTMPEESALFFHEVVMRSTWKLPADKFYSSGHWFVDEDHPPTPHICPPKYRHIWTVNKPKI